MNARRRTLESPLLGADLDDVAADPARPADTASLDNALEWLRTRPAQSSRGIVSSPTWVVGVRKPDDIEFVWLSPVSNAIKN